MSNHDNARRDEKKRGEHGSRWEGADHVSACASKSRKKWKDIKTKTMRRTNKVTKSYHWTKPGKLAPLPSVKEDE